MNAPLKYCGLAAAEGDRLAPAILGLHTLLNYIIRLATTMLTAVDASIHLLSPSFAAVPSNTGNVRLSLFPEAVPLLPPAAHSARHFAMTSRNN